LGLKNIDFYAERSKVGHVNGNGKEGLIDEGAMMALGDVKMPNSTTEG
jgi:hypothetical protein